jgi:hypothetical protein
MPILFRDRLEPRIERDEGFVRVLNLWWEDGFDPRRVEGFVDAMQARSALTSTSPGHCPSASGWPVSEMEASAVPR